MSRHPVRSSAIRLERCINTISEAAFALYEHHWTAKSLSVVPHLVKSLPALGAVNGLYQGKPLIHYLTELLKENDRNRREEAAEALGRMGESAAEAVPALVQALQDEDWRVQIRAVDALGEIGEKISEAVSALLLALQSQNRDVRLRTVETLGELGEKASVTVNALIQTLCDTNEDMRSRSAEALGKMNEQAVALIPILLEALSDTDERVQSSVAVALVNLGMQASSTLVPALIRALQSRNVDVRCWSVMALGIMGEKASNAVPELISLLRDEDEFVRRHSAETLGQIGERASEAVPTLVLDLRDEDGDVRSMAAESLGLIGERASAAVPALVQACEDKDPRVRERVVEALGRFGEKACEALPDLTRLLQDEDVLYVVQEALVQIGDKAVPAIIQVLQNETAREERVWAAKALGTICVRVPEAVPALLHALEDEDCYVQISAAEALGAMGEQSSEAVHALIHILENDWHVRSEAAEALGRIGEKAVEAIPALMRFLENRYEDDLRRESMAEALGALSKYSDEGIPALANALRYNSVQIRRASIQALGMAGEKASWVVPDLHDIVKFVNYEPDILQEGLRLAPTTTLAVEALCKIGEHALSALISILRNGDWEVQKYAAEGLSKLGRKASAAMPVLFECIQNNGEDLYMWGAMTNLLEAGFRLFQPRYAESLEEYAVCNVADLQCGTRPFPIIPADAEDILSPHAQIVVDMSEEEFTRILEIRRQSKIQQ